MTKNQAKERCKKRKDANKYKISLFEMELKKREHRKIKKIKLKKIFPDE